MIVDHYQAHCSSVVGAEDNEWATTRPTVAVDSILVVGAEVNEWTTTRPTVAVVSIVVVGAEINESGPLPGPL